MAWDAKTRSHHPGSPLFGGRAGSSSSSGSFLRKLTSLTKRSKSQSALRSARYAAASSSFSPPPSPTPSDTMAFAAAQAASLKATATTSITINPNTARPIWGSRTQGPAPTPDACDAPLAVQVEIRFPGLDVQASAPAYTHEYASSQDLVVTNRLCKGLLRRLTHCSTELITRKDSRALRQQHRQGNPESVKPLIYELHFRIIRKDAGIWAEKTFCSYQKQDITSHDAHEIVLAAHRMVGLFLRRHDPSFLWTDVPSVEMAAFVPRPDEPQLVRHTVGRPLPLSCVPQSRFLDDTQAFEFAPGYAVNLSFRSRCHGRKQYEWKRVISLQSKQNAPLDLAIAEDLLWDTFGSVNSVLTSRREAFLEEHKSCDFLEGVVSCQHFGEDALDIEISIENKLGPNYDHLNRTIRSQLGVFRDPDALDCQEFVKRVHGSMLLLRDSTDGRIGALPDFDLRLLTLSGPTWSVENPARFMLDTSTSYSRRSVEAILDRVQTGISDVLRNKDCTTHIVAYKRGHLILDKALIARPLPPKPALFPMAPVGEKSDTIVARLKERIHNDLNAVCKDTCSLDGVLENTDNGENAEMAQGDGLPESSAPSSPVPSAFEHTVILEDPAVAEEEPTIPAPRVVELPGDTFFGDVDLSPPSPTPSTRRRAFPLIPEKFTVPHSRSSSSVNFATSMPNEIGLADTPDNVTVDDTVDDAAGAPVADVAQEVIPKPEDLSPAFPADGTPEADTPLSEEPEEVVVEEHFDLEAEQSFEEEPMPTPKDEIKANTDAATEETHLDEPVHEQTESAYKVEAPPNFYSFDEAEGQPPVGLRFERQGSPTVGTPLETILEYDSELDTEFAFELPAYEQYIPALSSRPSSWSAAPLFGPEPHTTADERLAALAAGPLLESAFESAYESGPESVFKSVSRRMSASDGNEPFIYSSPPRNDDDESFAADTTLLTTPSSDFTRPSTPSLSLSSGEFNSPQISLLDTPNIGHEKNAVTLSCFDADGAANFEFGRGYDADGESDTGPGDFAQFMGDEKSSSQSVASQSLFGQPLTASFPSSRNPDLSESESAPTEIWRGAADEISTGTDAMEQLLKFEPKLDTITLPSPQRGISFEDSFEDFAMTKPSLDLDEYAEAAPYEAAISVEVSKTMVEDCTPEITALDDYEHQEAEYGIVEEEHLMGAHVDVDVQADVETEHESELEIAQHIEFTPALPSEPDLELLEVLSESGDVQDLQQEQPAEPARFQTTLAEFEEAVELLLRDVMLESEVESELAGPTYEPEQQQLPQQWLELAVPASELQPDSNHTADIIEPAEEPDAEPASESSLVREVHYTTCDNSGSDEDVESDLFSLPESRDATATSEQNQIQEPDVVEALELIIESVSTAEDSTLSPETTVQELSGGDSLPPMSVLHMDSKRIVDEEPTDAAQATQDLCVQEQDCGISPTQFNVNADLDPMSTNESRQAKECLSETDILLQPEERYRSEAASIAEPGSTPAPLLQTPTKDNTAKQSVALDSVLQTCIVEDDPALVLQAAAKSLSLDSATSSLSPLAPITDGSSSQGDCDAPSCSEETTRDSIDTMDGFSDDNEPPETKRLMSWSLPTVGLLGLDESRLVKVGLRGALTGSHAFDNVPFKIRKRQHRYAPVLAAATDEVESAPREAPTDGTAEAPALGQDGVLPRVAMMFASMAIMSQIIHKSS